MDDIVNQRAAFGIQPLHHGFGNALRQVAADLGDGVAHVVHGFVDVGAERKFDGGGRRAVGNRGGDVAHAGHAGQCVFNPRGYGFFHFVGRCAGLCHGNGNNREADAWVGVDGQPLEGERADNGQHDEQHDGKYRLADGP